jgi:PIN domain nuclease of toxin-antitoxin system
MNLLLDTHVFLWWDSNLPDLGVNARAAIRDPANLVFVSAVSVWEIAIKCRLGRLPFQGSPTANIARNGFTALAILPEHGEAAGALPLLHADPFDRLLIAQAGLEQLTLVTVDEKIRQYSVPQLWARG